MWKEDINLGYLYIEIIVYTCRFNHRTLVKIHPDIENISSFNLLEWDMNTFGSKKRMKVYVQFKKTNKKNIGK